VTYRQVRPESTPDREHVPAAGGVGARPVRAGNEQQIARELSRDEGANGSRWPRQPEAEPLKPLLHTEGLSLARRHVAIITPPMKTEAGDGGNRSLDATDARILRLLEANGRATYEEIGRLVNLSANAVRGRIKALAKREVIRGIHADIDRAGGGPKVEALIDIRLDPGANDGRFEQAAIATPGAVLLEHLAGPIHYQLRVAVSTTEALDDVIRQLKRSCPREHQHEGDHTLHARELTRRRRSSMLRERASQCARHERGQGSDRARYPSVIYRGPCCRQAADSLIGDTDHSDDSL
jgi:Lrp/AsnC family transcriptional regulator, leucine-responsive regulatory protein